MHRKPLLVYCFILIYFAGWILGLIPGAESVVLSVDDDGDKDFVVIQKAIDFAEDGDTIFIYSGTYNETCVVNKSVSIIGENQVFTVVNGSRTDSVFTLTADNISISNLTIEFGRVEFPLAGIAIYSANNKVMRCTLVDNYYGIVLNFPAKHNVIHENYIGDNHQCGIYFSETEFNVLTDNVVVNQPINGFGLYDFSNNNQMINNTLELNDDHGINIRDSYDNIVIGNVFLNNTYGIHVPPPRFRTRFENNVFSNNSMDFDFEPSPMYVTLPETVVFVFLGLLFVRKFCF